jgi:hypothetical protein
MRAADARRIPVGAWVMAAFSNSTRPALVISIQWPHFIIQTILASGEMRERPALYRRLRLPTEAELAQVAEVELAHRAWLDEQLRERLATIHGRGGGA